MLRMSTTAYLPTTDRAAFGTRVGARLGFGTTTTIITITPFRGASG